VPREVGYPGGKISISSGMNSVQVAAADSKLNGRREENSRCANRDAVAIQAHAACGDARGIGLRCGTFVQNVPVVGKGGNHACGTCHYSGVARHRADLQQGAYRRVVTRRGRGPVAAGGPKGGYCPKRILLPCGRQAVACGWRSPIQRHVSIGAKVAGADTKGGNGIQWWITWDSQAGDQVLASGGIQRGQTQSIPTAARLSELPVARGDVVSLVVGPKGGHSFDTTVVELTITELGGEARRWDLTSDVADSVQAANPHADSLGNAAVWYFYVPQSIPEAEARPVMQPSQATSAREFERELAARNLKTIRQRVREHEEQTWEGAMRALHPGGNWPPYPRPEWEPPAQIELPDKRLTDAWRSGAWHLLRVLNKDGQGRYIMRDYPYDALAHESFLIIRALDLQGMHQAARDGLARWLERDEQQPARMDGQFADTVGAMSGVEWDWQHAGGPGVIEWQMVEHYLLTGDRDWFARAAPKLQANADWMIRQRRAYLKDVPGRERLWMRGPPRVHGWPRAKGLR
jgi:hypothetical protein